MTENDGFQRDHRVEPAPASASQLPASAKWGIIAALVAFAIVAVVVLFATGGLSFVGR